MLKSFSFLALAAMVLPLAVQAEEAKTQNAPKGVYVQINPEKGTVSFYRDDVNNRDEVQAELNKLSNDKAAQKALTVKLTASITTKANHIATMTLDEYNKSLKNDASEPTCCGWYGGWGWRGWGGWYYGGCGWGGYGYSYRSYYGWGGCGYYGGGCGWYW